MRVRFWSPALLIFLFFFGVVCHPFAGWADPASVRPLSNPPSNSNESLNARLQAFLAAAKPQLGEITPWQSKLFDQEVVPEYQRFVRDYRQGPGGVIEAEIDFEGIRKYLSFYAPKSLKRESAPLIVVLDPARDCSQCLAATDVMKKLVSERLNHRGFAPLWIAPSELPGANLLQSASHFSEQKRAVGTLLLQWGSAPAEEEESRYQIHSTFELAGFGRYEASLDLLEAGGFGRSAGKLLTDAFTEMGDKAMALERVQPVSGKKEALIEINGFGDYSGYVAIRDAIQNLVQDYGRLEEKRIARSNSVFALASGAPAAQISEKLKGFRAGSWVASRVDLDGQTIHLDLQVAEKSSSEKGHIR